MANPERTELNELALFYEGRVQPEIREWMVSIPYDHCRREIVMAGDSGYSRVEYYLNEESQEWADMSLHSDYWVYGPDFLPTDHYDWDSLTGQKQARCSFMVTSYKDYIAAKLRWE